ncbi:MAG: DUF5714 domain-containing protein [Actinobacteria bacterium]|nr:DUF5714 domain-containing protein [Actinomycetota bacterium]
MNQISHTEQCGICGGKLTYSEEARPFTCFICGSSEVGHVFCSAGHYLCELCHGADFRQLLPQLLDASDGVSASEIAEELMARPELPMLGCEHALIAAGALITALRNRGNLGVTHRHVIEVLERATRQAISAYCGLSGVCGVVPALGACYSVLIGAQCGKGPETRATMELVSRLAAATAEEAEPGCCKAFVRSCLAVTEGVLEERLGIPTSPRKRIICRHVDRHPHGCRGSACEYHPEHCSSGWGTEFTPAQPGKEESSSCFVAAGVENEAGHG